eukprot:3029495-Alexandrium_andersonii.AAC.1
MTVAQAGSSSASSPSRRGVLRGRAPRPVRRGVLAAGLEAPAPSVGAGPDVGGCGSGGGSGRSIGS